MAMFLTVLALVIPFCCPLFQIFLIYEYPLTDQTPLEIFSIGYNNSKYFKYIHF